MELLRKNYTMSILLLCTLVLLLAAIFIISRMRWIRKEKKLSDEKHKVAIELSEQRQIAERLRHAAYIPASTHNEAMLSGSWTSIAQ